MFKIDKKNVVNETDKLLYNIWECLNKEEVTKPLIDCKYCGGTHENKGQLLACAKKHKKK